MRPRRLKLGDTPQLWSDKQLPYPTDIAVTGPHYLDELHRALPSSGTWEPITFQIGSQYIDPSVDQPLTDLKLRVVSLVPKPSDLIGGKHPSLTILWTLSGFIVTEELNELKTGGYDCRFAVVSCHQIRATTEIVRWLHMLIYPLALKGSDATLAQLPIPASVHATPD